MTALSFTLSVATWGCLRLHLILTAFRALRCRCPSTVWHPSLGSCVLPCALSNPTCHALCPAVPSGSRGFGCRPGVPAARVRPDGGPQRPHRPRPVPAHHHGLLGGGQAGPGPGGSGAGRPPCRGHKVMRGPLGPCHASVRLWAGCAQPRPAGLVCLLRCLLGGPCEVVHEKPNAKKRPLVLFVCIRLAQCVEGSRRR